MKELGSLLRIGDCVSYFMGPKMAKDNDEKAWKKLGYVHLWRAFKDDPLWKKKRKFSQWEAWLDLYMDASGIDRMIEFRKKTIKVKRGQLITSQWSLAKRWKWSRGSVRNFLAKLEKRRAILVESIVLSQGYSKITLLKYGDLNPFKPENENEI